MLLTEKITTTWTKTCGLYTADEYSMSIVSAATVLELTANIVIRSELEDRATLSNHIDITIIPAPITGYNLPSNFVNSIMRWANGIEGKNQRIIKEILKGTPRGETWNNNREKIIYINDNRNEVIHQAVIKEKTTAYKVIENLYEITSSIIPIYNPGFVLDFNITK